MEKKKSRRWLIIAVAILVIAAAVAIILLITKKKDSYRVIKIYEVEGAAFVQRDGVDDLEPYANMLLKSGDTVRVDAGSMTLKLDEDKYVYVEENTEFKLIAQGTDENSKTAIELTKGAITNEIQNKLSTESSYEVNTPNATMAVRGTVFRVEVTYDEAGVCYTKVSTLEGKVASRLVYADGSVSEQEVLIVHGYEVIIYQDDKNTDYMGDVEPIDFSKLPQAVSERFGALIDELKEELGLKEETTNQKSEYTVTFLYNGAVEQNDRLSKMVKTLLDMSELQTVGRDEAIMVDALVDEVLADLEPLAREKHVELTGNCEAITIVGSDILIYRLVYNLVENAIKYNHPGGQVTVSASRKEKRVCLSVADTGNGIPEELRERVFEPFFRVDKSRSRALGGVGLGLALVHEIVRVHEGSITVRSNPSGGTVFEVMFTQ